MHKMMIIVISRNIDNVSDFPDIVLGDIYYKWGGGGVLKTDFEQRYFSTTLV